jgi:tRNA 2-thiouridine synthesizing protein E
MSKTIVCGIEIETDDDGFMQEPGKWNQEVAEGLARDENASPLTGDHWKIVNYIRDYFLKFGIAPPVRMVCKHTGFSLEIISVLFPHGLARQACKIAGLPKPTGCV